MDEPAPSPSDTPRASREEIAEFLEDQELLGAITRFVRGRVGLAESSDVVQAAVTDALASKSAPADPEQFRKWLFGVTRHKIADHFRRRGRDPIPDEHAGEEASAESAPHSARELLRWAKKELPEGDQNENTLEWMLREGAGEKLEHIAEEANLPAPRVRQRVSRLRRYFRSRWAATASVAGVIALFLFFAWDRDEVEPTPPIAKEPPREAGPRQVELRRLAHEACAQNQWRRCLVLFDDAAKLDPTGDQEARIQKARSRAAARIAEENIPNQVVPDAGPEESPEPEPTEEENQNNSKSDPAPRKAQPPPQKSDDKPAPPPAPQPAPTQQNDGKQKTAPKAPGKKSAPGELDLEQRMKGKK